MRLIASGAYKWKKLTKRREQFLSLYLKAESFQFLGKANVASQTRTLPINGDLRPTNMSAMS
ncbi:hypothetical protein BZG13_12175 [Salinivibrio sp. ML323]|nr:hypothetical protein BZG13_12175 [Salinivibrio sp. ML323]